jgi:hypothetical protein
MAYAPSGLPRKQPSGPRLALDDLLARVHRRLYPDTIPVLASYWLKTVYSAGHNLAWWSQLDAAIREEQPSAGVAAQQALADIQDYIRQEILNRHSAPDPRPPAAPPFRPELTADHAVAYVCRLLNEWLPSEVARLLTGELQNLPVDEGGMPPLAVGKAVEHLLSRERFSPQTLEAFLQPALVCAYPAHAEILRDVVLSLLGRTAAPAVPLLPAVPLTIAGAPTLPPGFVEAVGRASLVPGPEGAEELCVPLEETQALGLLDHDPGRISSILVTVDGRWWESVRLLGGPECALVYRPGGRLRIDFTAEHARLVLPWPVSAAYWPGEVRLPSRFEIFGREWRSVAWERTLDRAWLLLEFTRALAMPQADDDAGLRHPRLRPASAEMAWSELEQALAAALAQRSLAPVDQLRRGDLIPLARAILRLADGLRKPSRDNLAAIEQSLVSLRYHQGAVAAAYGRIPSRVLPPPVLDAFRQLRADPRWTGLLDEIWEDTPASQAA